MHGSLPIYSGGLGILAGDILKEASDLALPMVGVGLMYRTGYFHQRIDATGYQYEYWLDADPERLPCVKVTGDDGRPVIVTVPVNDESVAAQIWRVDVGRVPLYLLDTDLPQNSQVGRWITSRLYESSRPIRLAQYAVLGVGGVRALRALGITPSVYHLNEGHPALGVFELLAQAQAEGGKDDAWSQVREQVVFTTHTPVPAGNETYQRTEVLAMLGRIADRVGDRERFLAMGRVDPANPNQPMGMTALALRASRHANGVSQRHGEVARAMWQPLFPDRAVQDVPISHVTNGVHVPTWLQGPMRELLDRHLGPGWLSRADQNATWAPVRDIPAAELWAARCTSRRQLVDMITRRATSDRLRRGDSLEYAQAPSDGFDPDRITIGFARRLATYKRLHLVALLPERALALIGGAQPVQFVFAGKAHPDDIGAKEVVRQVFALKRAPSVAGRAAFLEDYDIPLAGQLVAGCDVWINVPRPPNEASGTSGMKSCLNGGLQLSVLDGWRAWQQFILLRILQNLCRHLGMALVPWIFQGKHMAISPHFFNKREPEPAPVRPIASTSGAGSYGGAGSASAPPAAAPAAVSSVVSNSPAMAEGGSKLTVGPNIKLKGVEITDCDTLVVEGFVEATMDSRVMQIAERGAFKGSAEIDIAEIHGQFDGNLTVRQKLTIFATGKVTGKIRYGKVVIEEGGQLTGDIQFGAAPAAKSAGVEKSGLSLAG